MITRQLPVALSLQYPFPQSMDKIVFFDIETTGLSANTSYLYLIGCIYYRDSSFQMIQWFSEDISEERKLLTAFFTFLKDCEVLIHYNGSAFDIPYLLKKCVQLKLNYTFSPFLCLDLYKRIFPYRKLLGLENYKQKTLEAFLKVERRDTFSGGDLIEVYQSYLGRKRYETLKSRHTSDSAVPEPSQADALLGQLLLHNEDDLKGLVSICPILSYADLMEKPVQITSTTMDENQLIIHSSLPCALPVPIDHENNLIQLTAHGTGVLLRIEICHGALKFFYDNYKDYYYLPAEDTAVHKSVALFVDKEYRIKAKPSTCYTKKQGSFVPQFQPIITPCFQFDYHDKISYIEINEAFLSDPAALSKYATHLLSCMIK